MVFLMMLLMTMIMMMVVTVVPILLSKGFKVFYKITTINNTHMVLTMCQALF